MIVPQNKKSCHYYFALQHCCYRKYIHFKYRLTQVMQLSSESEKSNSICTTIFTLGEFQHYNFSFCHLNF